MTWFCNSRNDFLIYLTTVAINRRNHLNLCNNIAIAYQDPRALLFHARDRMTDVVTDSKETRRRGWRRMCLFGLVFYPSGIEVSGVKETFDNLKYVNGEMKDLGRGKHHQYYSLSGIRGTFELCF